MSITGHIIGGPVDPDYHGANLTADLAVGGTTLTVDDAGDFDEDAAERNGHVIIGMELDGDGKPDPNTGTTLAYTTYDDATNTITLAAGSPVAASAGDKVYVHDPVTGLPVTTLEVMVAVDNADTTGDALPATVDASMLGATGTDVDLTDQAVEMDEDEDGLLHITALPGLIAAQDSVKAMQDELTVTATGDQTLTLSYRPLKNSEHLYWNGVYQKASEWSRTDWTVTIPDPGSVIEAGDVLAMEYLYTDPTTAPAPVSGTTVLHMTVVSVTNGNVVDPSQWVGGGTAWSDASDGSYTNTYTSYNSAVDPGAYQDQSYATIDTLSIPTGTSITDVTLSIRLAASAATPQTMVPYIALRDSSGTEFYHFAALTGVTGSTADYTLSVPSGSLASVGSSLIGSNRQLLVYAVSRNDYPAEYHYGVKTFSASLSVSYA